MSVDAAVIGAGGPTGLKCVEKLLEQKLSVRAIVRNPDKYRAELPTDSHLELVAGDVTNAESLAKALRGVKSVIFAASGQSYFSANAVDKQGVKNVVDAVKTHKAHVVLITSALVTPKNRFNFIRILLNNIRWGLMDAKFAGEELLRASGVSYTIVRPGGLTDDAPGTAKLIAAQRDIGRPGRVARADVAAVCIAALSNPKAKNITLELSSDKDSPPGDPNRIFDDLQPGVYQ